MQSMQMVCSQIDRACSIGYEFMNHVHCHGAMVAASALVYKNMSQPIFLEVRKRVFTLLKKKKLYWPPLEYICIYFVEYIQSILKFLLFMNLPYINSSCRNMIPFPHSFLLLAFLRSVNMLIYAGHLQQHLQKAIHIHKQPEAAACLNMENGAHSLY